MTKIFGIGIYDKEDYEETLRISEDRDQMDLTWEDWKKSKTNNRCFQKNILI